MPSDLLFEIGCEEVPAKMLARALAELPAAVEARLAAARLAHTGVRALGTPRRLAILISGLAERQPDLVEDVVGPPAGAAFAADGTLTKAGAGFAAKNGVEPAAVDKREVAGKKGLYAVATRRIAGQDTPSLLPAMLAEVARGIAWPKSQRWGWSEIAFVRPVQWLLALYGGEVVPVEFANQRAGRTTRGHRFLAPGAIEIATPAHYVEALRGARVLVEPGERRARVVEELARLAAETGTRIRPDDGLVDEVTNLGEWPVGVSGQFDPAYLEVPEEIIVTAMRNHQRYFAMEDASGKLANRFATMMATEVIDPAVVQRGNEYVIAARLSDARFFFAEDRKKGSFGPWNDKLESVVFQAKLGDRAKTIAHKVARLGDIAQALAPAAGIDAAQVAEAASASKADLASGAVGEFPELQGTMGRYYAKHFGSSDEVGAAIEQHWWPKGQGAALPTSDAGALLALIDRMDTVVGCFAVGLEPSGSADPYGLRRAAIGSWQILLDRPAWSGLWRQVFDRTRDALAAQGVALKSPAAVEDFFRSRLRGILVDQDGIPAQDADAVLAQGFDDPGDARDRARSLGKLPREAREVFKRVANILEDAAAKQLPVPGEIDPTKFVNPVETTLHAAVEVAQQRASELRRARDYAGVFGSLVELQPAVAAFFDKGGVMVMDPDPALRGNRLALLTQLLAPYRAIADFRLLGGAA